MIKPLQLHVSPQGDDAGPGTFTCPMRTLHAALEAAKHRRSGTFGEVQVRLAGGTYPLEATLVVGPEHSGLTLCAEEEGRIPVLTGLLALNNRRPVNDPDLPLSPEARGCLWEADLPGGELPQALYVNGVRRPLAMWPKQDRWEEWPQCAPGAHRQEILIPKNLQRRHASEQDIVLNLLSTPYTRWINYRAAIRSIRGDRIAVSRPLTPNDYLPLARTIPFRIENALEALTEPGEWCAERNRKKIYYWPVPGENTPTAHLAVPRLSCAVRIQGTERNPVREVHLDGVQIERTGGEEAAVELSGSVNCSVCRCVLQDLEGQAVRSSGFSRGLRIADCSIHRCGKNGIMVCAPHCNEREMSRNTVIERNEISRCGQVNWQDAGILIRGASQSTVRENDMHDLPYAAIAVSGVRLFFVMTRNVPDWPADAVSLERIREESLNIETFKKYVCGHNTIESNRIRDVMMQLDDGGAIYCHASHHNLVRGNTIRRTRRACSHGLYFDDDEVNSVMEGNRIFDSPSLPGGGSSIHIHDNARNTIRGNRVFGSHCPFTFPRSYGGHQVTENLFVLKRDARMPSPPQRNQGRYPETKWDAGENVFDGNVYWSDDHGETARKVLQAQQASGFDRNSSVEEPSTELLRE